MRWPRTWPSARSTRWLNRHGRLADDPLAVASKIRESADIRRKRRPMDDGEVARLIAAAEAGPDVSWERDGMAYTMTGQARGLLYLLLSGTGIRHGEAASLTAASFALDAQDGPELVVEAGYSKRRRRDVIPIPARVADRLRPWLKIQPKNGILWPKPHKPVDVLLMPDLDRAREHYLEEAASPEERTARRQSSVLVYRDQPVATPTSTRSGTGM